MRKGESVETLGDPDSELLFLLGLHFSEHLSAAEHQSETSPKVAMLIREYHAEFRMITGLTYLENMTGVGMFSVICSS